MDQYLYIPFLGGWTSIYQLFWCSPGVQGFDTLPGWLILFYFFWSVKVFSGGFWGPHRHLRPCFRDSCHQEPQFTQLIREDPGQEDSPDIEASAEKNCCGIDDTKCMDPSACNVSKMHVNPYVKRANSICQGCQFEWISGAPRNSTATIVFRPGAARSAASTFRVAKCWWPPYPRGGWWLVPVYFPVVLMINTQLLPVEKVY